VLPISYQHTLIEAGCDEAGRGCYAGPVVAAAVILPPNFTNDLLNDSKKLTAVQREALKIIIEKEALAYAVAFVTETEIDSTNILKASIKAMHLAVDKLKVKPKFLAIDGNKFYTYKKIPHQTIVKGDGKYANIAAASVLAKTYRDAYMQKIDAEYPHYGWAANKGYGTLIHRQAIEKHGICKYHRKSFNIIPLQQELF
jgi:ribonuclease HII